MPIDQKLIDLVFRQAIDAALKQVSDDCGEPTEPVSLFEIKGV